jgi:hypothetical protein
MINTSIIPNCEIIRILPPMTDLQIMILDNQLNEPVQGPLALFLGQPIDLLDVVPYAKYRFPASDWVGANYGMDGLQVCADVLRSPAGFGVELETVLLGAEAEAGLCVGGCEAFEELLVWLGETIVKFIPRCPERI